MFCEYASITQSVIILLHSGSAIYCLCCKIASNSSILASPRPRRYSHCQMTCTVTAGPPSSVASYNNPPHSHALPCHSSPTRIFRPESFQYQPSLDALLTAAKPSAMTAPRAPPYIPINIIRIYLLHYVLYIFLRSDRLLSVPDRSATPSHPFCRLGRLVTWCAAILFCLFSSSSCLLHPRVPITSLVKYIPRSGVNCCLFMSQYQYQKNKKDCHHTQFDLFAGGTRLSMFDAMRAR